LLFLSSVLLAGEEAKPETKGLAETPKPEAPTKKPAAEAPSVDRPLPEAHAAENIYVIVFHGQTNELNYHSLKRRLENAVQFKADLVIVDIDSPGGPVETSVEIAKLLGDFDAAPLVVHVSKQALSGGAMASLGSPAIVMEHGTVIGASQVIIMTPGQEQPIQPAPEKFVSRARAVVRSLAQNNGYPEAICEAMVDPDIQLYEVKMTDGSVRYLKQQAFEELQEGEEGRSIKSHSIICQKDKLLTLTEKEALEYGIAKHVVDDRDETVRMYGTQNAQVTVLRRTSGEQVLAVLNTGWLTSLLLLVGLGSLYFALKTPGFGIPETMAIACFAVFFFSKMMVGQADVLEVALFFVGVALIALEIFVIPGFGVVGITGIAMVFVSLVLAMQSFTIPSSPFEWGVTLGNVAEVAVLLVVATIGFMFLVRLAPETPLLRRLVSTSRVSAESGYVAPSHEKRSLAGSKGLAVSDLRPAGRIEVNGEVLDAVTQGDLIEAGEPVKIIEVTGNRVIVARA